MLITSKGKARDPFCLSSDESLQCVAGRADTKGGGACPGTLLPPFMCFTSDFHLASTALGQGVKARVCLGTVFTFSQRNAYPHYPIHTALTSEASLLAFALILWSCAFSFQSLVSVIDAILFERFLELDSTSSLHF